MQIVECGEVSFDDPTITDSPTATPALPAPTALQTIFIELSPCESVYIRYLEQDGNTFLKIIPISFVVPPLQEFYYIHQNAVYLYEMIMHILLPIMVQNRKAMLYWKN